VTSRARLVGAGALLLALGILIGSVTGGTLAAFTKTTQNTGNSFTAKRIFPAAHSIAAHDVLDATGASAANVSDPFAVAGDGLTATTSGSPSSGSNTYLEFTMTSQLPATVAVSGVAFDFNFASAGPGSGDACFWFQARSSGNVVGTHGSYAAPLACSTGTTPLETDTLLPEVTSSDVANGLVIRVYVWNTKSKAVVVDRAEVTGSTPYGTFTSYSTTVTDTTSGSASTPWALENTDGVAITTSTAFPTSSNPAKYLRLSFDPSIPTGATVSSATLTFVWRPSGTVSSPGLCYSVDILQGATLLASHGTSSSPYSCNTSGTTGKTDAISLPEVDSAAKADGLVARFVMWGPACGAGCPRSVVDQGLLTVNYSLD
jgi:predicted ribosomally synthesized peptide with SipW-like signal peptide